jgi:hypothetical protein
MLHAACCFRAQSLPKHLQPRRQCCLFRRSRCALPSLTYVPIAVDLPPTPAAAAPPSTATPQHRCAREHPSQKQRLCYQPFMLLLRTFSSIAQVPVLPVPSLLLHSLPVTYMPIANDLPRIPCCYCCYCCFSSIHCHTTDAGADIHCRSSGGADNHSWCFFAHFFTTNMYSLGASAACFVTLPALFPLYLHASCCRPPPTPAAAALPSTAPHHRCGCRHPLQKQRRC